MTRRRGRPAVAVAGVAVLAALACGCGIRSTTVPVDAGAAPSRVACVVPGGGEAPATPRDTVVPVYLVCGSRVAPVQRAVNLPDGQVAVARKLLRSLAEEPAPHESAAGFESPVHGDLRIGPGATDDPAGTLRLNTPPEELASFALAQIVCTFADTTAAAGDGSVILGGPDNDARRYACTSALRNNAEAGRTAGEPV